MIRFMMTVVSCLVLMLGCAAEEESPPPSVYGNWMYVNSDGSAGIALSLNQNGKYVYSVLRLTSDSSAQAIVEKGVFTTQNSEFTFTPEESSCAESSTTTTSYTYTLAKDGSLRVLLPEGIISLQRNTSDGTSNFVIAFGCLKDGKFVESPIVKL